MLIAKPDPGWFYPVGWVHDVGDGPYATRLLGADLVLWRGADGRLSAARDRCPHRGTRLSLGERSAAGELTCPYHGWTFGSDGRATHIPQLAPGTPIAARCQLDLVRVEERYGLAWVALAEPRGPIPSWDAWDDPNVRHVACAPYTWRASPERMVENFMDLAHLGWLHDGLLGTRDDLVVPDHRVERAGTTLVAEVTMDVPQVAEMGITAFDGTRGKQTNSYVVTAPYTIVLRSTYHDTGRSRYLLFSAQPLDDELTVGYCYQSRDFGHDLADAPFAEFQAILAEQDRPIVESQVPRSAPLRLTDELHMPFDRLTIAYRRLLAELIGTEVED